jgi:hypothetical protein
MEGIFKGLFDQSGGYSRRSQVGALRFFLRHLKVGEDD